MACFLFKIFSDTTCTLSYNMSIQFYAVIWWFVIQDIYLYKLNFCWVEVCILCSTFCMSSKFELNCCWYADDCHGQFPHQYKCRDTFRLWSTRSFMWCKLTVAEQRATVRCYGKELHGWWRWQPRPTVMCTNGEKWQCNSCANTSLVSVNSLTIQNYKKLCHLTTCITKTFSCDSCQCRNCQHSNLPLVGVHLFQLLLDFCSPYLKKWVPVTVAWQLEEQPSMRRVAANIFNKQSQTADKGCSSSLRVGWDANNSPPYKLALLWIRYMCLGSCSMT